MPEPEQLLDWQDPALATAVCVPGEHLWVRMQDLDVCHWCHRRRRLADPDCKYVPPGDFIEPPPEIPLLKGATLEQTALALLQQGKGFDLVLALAATWMNDNGSFRYPNLDTTRAEQ